MAAKLGAIINFDDITHIDFYEKIAPFQETMCCRYNPGGDFKIENEIMDTPQDAKYGMTRPQLTEAYRKLMAKGVKHFGLHAFLASNTVANEYYPVLARLLFQTAVELHKETGAHIAFVNLSGGVGIPYRPSRTQTISWSSARGVRRAYEEVLVPAGMGDVAIYTEMGRFVMGPYGCLVTRCLHHKHTHKEYVGVDACAPTSCVRPCTAHTTTSQCWARRMPPATTSTT